MDHAHVAADIERVVASNEEIQKRVAELAKQVGEDYRGRDLLLVGVLKGAVMLMADLSRALDRQVEMDWMAVSSYGSGTKSRDRKSTRLNSSHIPLSRMPSSA